MINKGSSWIKWDLHFHTQSSYDYKNKPVPNKDIIDELVANDVRVVAITDHHVMDVERISELQELGQGKITVLPGIEFLSDARGKQPVHFIAIFSEECDINYVWGQIENRTKIKEIKGEGKRHNEIYCHLEDTFDLIHELGGIITIHAGEKANSVENITHSLPHGTAQKTEIAHKVDIYELGKETDQEGYLDIVFPAIKKILPLIICSDNHDITDYKVKQNLWIKARPTFEGLKQIIHEPETRVKINENKPTAPLRTLQSLKLSFPSKTEIIHLEDRKKPTTENDFCLGQNIEIPFSPFFTCVIGGRGSGKSTILNLIAQETTGDTDFFNYNILRAGGKDILPQDYIEVEGTRDIEFISQNQVEKFANNEELTEAIYDRLRNGEFFKEFFALEENNEKNIKEIELQIENINEEYNLEQKISSLKNSLKEGQKIVNHYNSEKYKAITKSISEASNEKNEIERSENEYLNITEQINSIISEFKSDVIKDNSYDKEIKRIVSGLEKIIQPVSFDKDKQRLKTLEDLIIAKRQELETYMKMQGVSEEDSNEYERAVENNPIIESEIKQKEKELLETRRLIKAFKDNSHLIVESKTKFEQKIEISLSPMNEQLVNIDKNVADIRFEYRFNEELAKDNLLNEFEMQFKELRPSEISTKRNAVRDYLFCVEPWEVNDYEDYMSQLDSFRGDTNAKELVKELFQREVNFETYKLLISKVKNDVVTHKKIIGYYDNKEFKRCSFGQKCTAVIVALLMFGSKPIIIDEPEAHLDSKLIAEYLIKLIKRKKRNRQIIFATHNANFVINGDAELIHCLEIDETTNLTKITSTAIEDVENREMLLALEGGKEAFELRDKKLMK